MVRTRTRTMVRTRTRTRTRTLVLVYVLRVCSDPCPPCFLYFYCHMMFLSAKPNPMLWGCCTLVAGFRGLWLQFEAF